MSNSFWFNSAGAITPGGGGIDPGPGPDPLPPAIDFSLKESKSLLFDSGKGSRLTRTPDIAGNTRVWTFSCCIKRHDISSEDVLLDTRGTNSVWTTIYISSSGEIVFSWTAGQAGPVWSSVEVFNDVGAWYHIVVSVDTTANALSDRVRVWANGVQLTNAEQYPTTAQSFDFNSTIPHHIGGYLGPVSAQISAVAFVDGTAHTPEFFGRFDNNGVWELADPELVLEASYPEQTATLIESDFSDISSFPSLLGWGGHPASNGYVGTSWGTGQTWSDLTVTNTAGGGGSAGPGVNSTEETINLGDNLLPLGSWGTATGGTEGWVIDMGRVVTATIVQNGISSLVTTYTPDQTYGSGEAGTAVTDGFTGTGRFFWWVNPNQPTARLSINGVEVINTGTLTFDPPLQGVNSLRVFDQNSTHFLNGNEITSLEIGATWRTLYEGFNTVLSSLGNVPLNLTQSIQINGVFVTGDTFTLSARGADTGENTAVLKFNDTSSLPSLGLDSTSNNNDWTPYNFNLRQTVSVGDLSEAQPIYNTSGANGESLETGFRSDPYSSNLRLALSSLESYDYLYTGSFTESRWAGNSPDHLGAIFDGDPATYAHCGVPGSIETYTFGRPITVTSSLRIRAFKGDSGERVFANGIDISSAFSNQSGAFLTTQDVTSLVGTPPFELTSIASEQSPSFRAGALSLIEVDGQILKSNVFSDVHADILGSGSNLSITSNTAKARNQQSKFYHGENVVYFDGHIGQFGYQGFGDYLEVIDPSLQIGTGDFCLEMWVYPTALYTNVALFDNRHPTNNWPNSSGGFMVTANSNGDISLYSEGAMKITHNAKLTVGVWHHIAVTRESGTIRLFVNGDFFSSSYSSSNNYDQDRIVLGNSSQAAHEEFEGYMQDVRFYIGIPKYTQNFSVPGEFISFTSDSSLDSPVNLILSEGNNQGNYATLTPLTASSITKGDFSSGNLTFTANTNGILWAFAAGGFGMESGKWYFEAQTDGAIVGLVTAEWINVGGAISPVGNTLRGVGWSGRFLYTPPPNAGTLTTGLNGFSPSDIIQIAFDADTGKVWFGLNNTFYDENWAPLNADPENGVSPSCVLPLDTYLPAVSVLNTKKMSFNFGQSPFLYNPPAGFKSLCTTNIPDPVITDGSKGMNSSLYTGNGLARKIPTPYSPDLVWIKSRSAVYDHGLFDVIRGANQRISTNSDGPDGTEVNSVTAFNSDSFSLGTLAFYNNPSTSFVAWNWDAGETTSVISANSYSTQSPPSEGNPWRLGWAGYDEGRWNSNASWSNLPESTTPVSPANRADGRSTQTENFGDDGITPTSGMFGGGASGSRGWALRADKITTLTFDNLPDNLVDLRVSQSDNEQWGTLTPHPKAASITLTGKIFWCNYETSPSPSWTTAFGRITAGTISFPSLDSNVRANPAAGFSICTYSGSSDSPSFAHGLNTAPKLIIIKNLSAGADWFVMIDHGINYYRYGHLNKAQAFNNATQQIVTNTIVNLKNSNAWYSVDGNEFLAYCWAPIEGYSSFSSFKGSGDVDGPFVYTGFKPKWILLKNSNHSHSWIVFDTARNTSNPLISYLVPSNTSDEIDSVSSAEPIIEVVSNGFKVRSTAQSINADGDLIAYAAFAEHPYKFTRAA